MSISQVELTDTPVSSVSASPDSVQNTTPEDIVSQRISESVQNVEDAVAPVWPLKDYVAVNPYLGLAERDFLSARRLLRSISDSEILMPLEFYRARFQQGQLSAADIEEAGSELKVDQHSVPISASNVLAALESPLSDTRPALENSERRILTIAEIADSRGDSNWGEMICDEIGRYCAAHYDEGQAVWPSPWKHLPLFQAWRSAARVDRRPDALGLTLFHRFVDSLPHTADAVIAATLSQLNVPEELWESYLLCIAHSIPGWSSWTKYQANEARKAGDEGTDFTDLLAIRLVYEAALAQQTGFRMDWRSATRVRQLAGQSPRSLGGGDALTRFLLLRASEIAWQRQVLESLDLASTDANDFAGSGASEPAQQRSLAQMVFCIDVRSERYRRHLEHAGENIETYGFAGFFGVPIAFKAMGEETASAQVPALLSPQFTVQETLRDTSEQEQAAANRRRSFRRTLRKAWKQFQQSASGCFGFVETAGLPYGWKLLSAAMKKKSASSRFDGVLSTDQARLTPDLDSLTQQGIGAEQQTDMAESILRGIGITDNFAKLVVLCGHGSTTHNNPLKAGLDCGACCGHSGEPNARFAAALLNQPHVRSGLQKRGIDVPNDTHFVSAVHDTTTDDVRYCDVDLLPELRRSDLRQLQQATTDASEQCRLDRMPSLQANTAEDVLNRARDWSEVRPEWGLAGNAAFIAAPRSLTENANLDGRAFLHSYCHHSDPEFNILEQIMTAPMVVAHWINMQYYASTVDNSHYGSGTKTVHNVVGKFGIFSGNGGDLTTGLPWQSVHNGTDYQHEPLRLLTVLAAPRDAVADIIQRNKVVEDLLVNRWLNLVVVEDGSAYRYTAQQTWTALQNSAAQPELQPA